MSAPEHAGPAGVDARFWEMADELVRTHPLVIDRPKGSRHPRFPEQVYPLDYGYLAGTTAADGDGIDVWHGSLPIADEHLPQRVTGIIATIDILKGDAEVKLLLGCTEEDARLALAQHDSHDQAAILVMRP